MIGYELVNLVLVVGWDSNTLFSPDDELLANLKLVHAL